MRIPDLDKILSAMLKTYDGISDLNFSVGHPLQVEDFGELKPVFVDPPIESLTPYQTEQVALTIMQNNRRLIYDYLTTGSCDCSYSLTDEARFRVSVFRQQGNFSVVLRKLEAHVPTIESLQLPPIFKEVAKEKTGLVLVTGATGSGKTTTLAAILNEINDTQPVHVITLEDPIEFVHPKLKATFNQRELGHDFNNYPNGLRAALRQAPKVILVGEMRDRATVEVALMAAETGHLVLSTLHTNSAVETIIRLLDMGLDPFNFADALLGILGQRLVKRICTDCRQEYHPERSEYDELAQAFGEEAFATLNQRFDGSFVLYRGKGCASCNKTGYRGRLGIHELLIATDELKRHIQSRARVAEMLELARAEGMTTLVQDGVLKTLGGLTDFRQVKAVAIK